MSKQDVIEAQCLLGTTQDGEFGPNDLKALKRALNVPVVAGKRISAEGLKIIKDAEGLRLNAYPDPASGGDPWTIGYGHTRNVKKGQSITKAQADIYICDDVREFEKAVEKAAPVTTQGQFDALVSFAFNLGEGALRGSTLLKKHNAGDYAGAANEFGKWVNGGGKVMPGLVTRRAAEAARYKA